MVASVADEMDVPLHPVPMTLTVELTDAGDRRAATGRTVVARATARSGPEANGRVTRGRSRRLPVCPRRVDRRFTPCEVLVDGDLVRTVAMDLTARATRDPPGRHHLTHEPRRAP